MTADTTSPALPAPPVPHWSSHFSTPDGEGMPVPKYSFGALPSLTQVTLRNRMNFELLVWEHFYAYDQDKKTFSSKGNALGLSVDEMTGILTMAQRCHSPNPPPLPTPADPNLAGILSNMMELMSKLVKAETPTPPRTDVCARRVRGKYLRRLKPLNHTKTWDQQSSQNSQKFRYLFYKQI